MTDEKIIDPPPVFMAFNPKPDITAYELALLLGRSTVRHEKLHISGDLPLSLARHFEPEIKP